MILGCAVLFGLFYLLIPGSSQRMGYHSEPGRRYRTLLVGSYFEVWSGSALALVKLIFTLENLVSWRFWVFLYLAICISANIRLSWSDFKHTLSGLGCFVSAVFPA